MAHGLTEKDTMFSVKERPWHGLGTVVQKAPSIDQAIELAGLDWEVGTRPLFNELGEQSKAQETYRQTDGRVFGYVGPGYRPLQNKDAFHFFQPILDQGLATLETAGSLFDGEKVWVMAKLNSEDSVIVKKADDRIEKFLLLSNSHDGTTAARVGFTPVRVVCNNTLTLAHEHRKSSLIKVLHTGNVVENLEALRETINAIDAQFEATAEQYRFLAGHKINQEDLKKYIKVVFDREADFESLDTFQDAKTMGPATKMVIELFETGRGNHLSGVKGTWWAAYNAMTEYLQYYRGRSQEIRLDSMWFKEGNRLNKRALDVALTATR